MITRPFSSEKTLFNGRLSMFETVISRFALSGKTVWLPENFHYAADYIESGVKRFNTDTGIPDDAENTRFLHDTLYMCVHLASDKDEMFENIKQLPKLASAKRDITVSNMDNLPLNKVFSDD